MIPTSSSRRRLALWLCLSSMVATAAGCSRTTSEASGPPGGPVAESVPVGGVITLDGAPLSRAVVTFMPGQGATYVGETDADGHYAIAGFDSEGAPAGDYTVAVSYLVSAEGEPQGLAARSSMTATPGMLTAREQLAREYADLGRSRLSATVGPRGGTFDFKVKRADATPRKGG